MVITLKHRIVELLSKDTQLNSISDIARKLKVAYSHAYNFTKQLIRENVITTTKIGNVSVCRINLKEQIALSYISATEAHRAMYWKRKNPYAEKIIEKIDIVKDNVHAVLVKGSNVIIIVPEKIANVDFSMFRNRTVINRVQLKKRKRYYSDAVILYGAEKYWSLQAD
jgi:hypothetical protein